MLYSDPEMNQYLSYKRDERRWFGMKEILLAKALFWQVRSEGALGNSLEINQGSLWK